VGNDVKLTAPDRSGRLLLLGIFALAFSWIPIIAIPSAIVLFVKAFRTFEGSESKGMIASSVGLGALALFLGIGSSIAGLSLVLDTNQRVGARESLLRVHEQIGQLETEMRSPEHAREVAGQWASIDISNCPEDYQEAYRSVVRLFFDLADHVENLKNPWENVRLFFEALASAMSERGGPTPALLVRDQELQERMNRVFSEFCLVCAKYGIRSIEPGKGL